MSRVSLFEFALALSIVGALTLIIINLLRLLGVSDVIIPYYWLIPSRYILPMIGGMGGDLIINMICGVIALIGSQRIRSPAWAIVLIAVGIIAGAVEGTLVLLGGILALINDMV